MEEPSEPDCKVIEMLLDEAEESTVQEQLSAHDNKRIMLSSQEINRWDRVPLSNEYIKRLSAQHFYRHRPKILEAERKAEEQIAIIVKEIEQKPIVLPREIKKHIDKPLLPRSGYLMPRKTYTPPISTAPSKVLCGMERPEKVKTRCKSRSTNIHHKRQTNSVELQNYIQHDLSAIPIKNKQPYHLNVSTFSFARVQKTIDPVLEQKNQRQMVNHMKHEALLKRLKYHPFMDRVLEERPQQQILTERQKVENHMLHYYRTKKMVRNKKLELIM